MNQSVYFSTFFLCHANIPLLHIRRNLIDHKLQHGVSNDVGEASQNSIALVRIDVMPADEQEAFATQYRVVLYSHDLRRFVRRRRESGTR